MPRAINNSTLIQADDSIIHLFFRLYSFFRDRQLTTFTV